MKRSEAEYFVEKVCRHELVLGFTDHFWRESGKCAPGLDVVDVLGALRTGRVHGAPVRDDAYICHKVKIRATLEEFGELELVLTITPLDQVSCLTIYPV